MERSSSEAEYLGYWHQEYETYWYGSSHPQVSGQRAAPGVSDELVGSSRVPVHF